MRRATPFGSLLGVVLVSLARPAAADDPRARGSVALGHAVGSPQDRELGFGVVSDIGIDVPVSTLFGVEGRVGGVLLADGSPPRDPRIADRPSGAAALLFAGGRVGRRGPGPWGDFGVGLVATGVARFGFDVRAGWDLAIDRRGYWNAGPMLGYLHVLQPNDTLRPEDAHLLFVGANVAYGTPAGPCADGDRDGICDPDDACPSEAGQRHHLATKNGCPARDRDRDGVLDDDDACPDVPGNRTDDPKTNGCPPEEPKAEVTRPDRDNDGVVDDEDACPDIPGVRTSDKATNGCPPAAGPVRVEGDRIVLDDVIHFDNNSPRVRSVSWPLIEKVARFILANPDILEIDIEGHADRVGTDAHNLRLSRERAEAVKRMLVKYGVQPDRVNARGFGESRPKSGSRTARVDRRVEFWVVRARPQESRSGSKP